MKIILTRAFQNQKATLGMLSIQGVEHDPIFTLENPWRYNLVDSSIPKGIYEVVPFSGPHFKNVWEVLNVKGRKAILIHAGNNEFDTTGCILLGLQAGSMNDQPTLISSRLAIEYFRKLVGENSFQLEII